MFVLLTVFGCYEPKGNPLAVDDDGDGYSEFDGDCDDTDPLSTIVSEDSNCDGIVDFYLASNGITAMCPFVVNSRFPYTGRFGVCDVWYDFYAQLVMY